MLGGHAFAWHGKGADESEKAYSEKLVGILGLDGITVVQEGAESEDFWNAVGGQTEYASEKVLRFAPGFQPRLFQITVAGGYSKFEEVKNFCQADLNNHDVMVLDAYSTIWVWVGSKSNKQERNNAHKKVDMYLSGLNDRDKSSVQISSLEPGFEPIQFTALFPEWEDEIVDTWFDQPE